MVGELRPLRAILRELKTLVTQQASGFLFILTADNQSSSIRLSHGHIEEVNFRNEYNDAAVELLSRVSSGRARFQPGAATTPSKRTPLGAAAMLWLLGGFENLHASPPVRRVEAVTGRLPETRGPTPAQRLIIEAMALDAFGPIGSLLCEEAFAASGELAPILRQIAANLPDREQAEHFFAQAEAAVKAGKPPA